MQYSINRDLERNVHAAIRALESERFYEFSHGLLMLLDKAKSSDRLLGSVLEGACGTPFEETQARLKEAEKQNGWWS